MPGGKYFGGHALLLKHNDGEGKRRNFHMQLQQRRARAGTRLTIVHLGFDIVLNFEAVFLTGCVDHQPLTDVGTILNTEPSPTKAGGVEGTVAKSTAGWSSARQTSDTGARSQRP